ILGMNMMFSCLFGVGYVIVRYRKNGYLKRLNATPLSALEFIVAQVLSRLLLIMSITVVIFAATWWILDLRVEGSFLGLFLLALLGSVSMIAMGLTISARVTSEELAGGLLNVLSWPMMFLSGVWFSLEGAPGWVQAAAEFLPLTHMLNGARAIMLDGAGLASLGYELFLMAAMTLVFLLLGAISFKWTME
ncbi:MAG: ABC transporter permease, partial [Nevskiales bacterium]